MGDYSNDSAAARENLEKFSTLWRDKEQRDKEIKRKLGRVAKEARQRDPLERRRDKTRERVARYRAAHKGTWAPRPVDLDRLRDEAQALRQWLEQSGQRQAQLRARAKEIMTSRALYTSHLALTGEEPTHRQLSEALSAKTGTAFTIRQGQRLLDTIHMLEDAGVWKPLPSRRDEIVLPDEVSKLLEDLDL
ncbi:UNVERIFIED_ORG: Arc/MetJ-type ribon-helix-helix transcriptional regulator [Xanthobacter viscosus]|uniref:Uncharacterized protein n=1 Tax=Xanthobacter autotrophicus TaxID=280 RepID=A0A6C1KY45_XANAU|nr:hypothetical protein [Xanthobacter autotrophicus]TLX44793.1 hypothetical protein FBQ73_01725 [Xanthobacter autotrophicus]